MDHAAGPIALEIGTGIDYSNYLDKVFESNTDYYFFVRAFSSIVVVVRVDVCVIVDHLLVCS